jgi:predicted nuclease of restriction endonuclease-like (RecB) superfamily
MRSSFSDEQLLALKVALGGRTWSAHALDARWTLKWWRWQYYVVFLAGRNKRALSARERQVQRLSMHAVNTALIDLYWQVGQTISQKIAQAQWGDGVVAQLADHLAHTQPGLRGFTTRNLFRMRQFYEAYQGDAIVSPLARRLPWTHNLIILNQSKRAEEREFYLRQAIREQWSKRELERQFKTALFERTVLHPIKVSPLVSQTHPEADLHLGLLQHLKDFLIELGRDFALDLLFFHRGLNCLVAFELKIGRFEPEYLGKLGFYLEALDRDVKKPHEQATIGVLLCASKDDEVVERAKPQPLPRAHCTVPNAVAG